MYFTVAVILFVHIKISHQTGQKEQSRAEQSTLLVLEVLFAFTKRLNGNCTMFPLSLTVMLCSVILYAPSPEPLGRVPSPPTHRIWREEAFKILYRQLRSTVEVRSGSRRATMYTITVQPL